MARRRNPMDVGQTITRDPVPTPTTAEDVLNARQRDRRLKTRERPATDAELRDLVARHVAWALGSHSPDEHADVASEIREKLARKYGTWHPPIWELDRTRIARRALTIWRDSRNRVADVADATAATDADADADADPATRTDAAVCWTGDRLPAADARWEDVADALNVDPDSDAGLAVWSALAGYGTGAAVADVLGITAATARKRLQRGREKLAAMYPDPDELADRMADADAADRPLLDGPVMVDGRQSAITGRWPTNGDPCEPVRVRLTHPLTTPAVLRRLRIALDRIASTDTAGHAAKLDREPRNAADPVPLSHGDRPTDDRVLPVPAGPVAVSRVQPERVTVATVRQYLPAGRPMDPTPTRTTRPLTAEDVADADRRWIAATTATPTRERFRAKTTAWLERDAADRVTVAALAAWRASRPWDRRRNQCHGWES